MLDKAFCFTFLFTQLYSRQNFVFPIFIQPTICIFEIKHSPYNHPLEKLLESPLVYIYYFNKPVNNTAMSIFLHAFLISRIISIGSTLRSRTTKSKDNIQIVEIYCENFPKTLFQFLILHLIQLTGLINFQFNVGIMYRRR